jgi:hypothetical protein
MDNFGRKFMELNPYKALAEGLDALPNGFPSTDDGLELDLLAKIVSAEEAAPVLARRPRF